MEKTKKSQCGFSGPNLNLIKKILISKKGITLPEVLVSSFIGLLVLGILLFFFIYHTQYFKAWLSSSEAQQDASVALKGMVENARFATGFLYSPQELEIRRIMYTTPEDTGTEYRFRYYLQGTELHRTATPQNGASLDRVLARGVTSFQVTNNNNTIQISLMVEKGSKKVELKDSITPKAMSLEGESLP